LNIVIISYNNYFVCLTFVLFNLTTGKELNSLLEELEDLFDDDDCSLIGLRTNLASAHETGARLNLNQESE
jgi:hypothetical protein